MQFNSVTHFYFHLVLNWLRIEGQVPDVKSIQEEESQLESLTYPDTQRESFLLTNQTQIRVTFTSHGHIHFSVMLNKDKLRTKSHGASQTIQ